MVREVPLTKGAVVLVDDADYEWAMRWRWCLGAGGYAVRAARDEHGKFQIKMHRALLGLPDRAGTQRDGNQLEGDHINGNRLDNRRENLRVLPVRANRQNRRARNDSRTGIRGVELRNYKGRITYNARLRISGKFTHLGTFPTVEQAAAAVQAALRVHMPVAVAPMAPNAPPRSDRWTAEQWQHEGNRYSDQSQSLWSQAINQPDPYRASELRDEAHQADRMAAHCWSRADHLRAQAPAND